MSSVLAVSHTPCKRTAMPCTALRTQANLHTKQVQQWRARATGSNRPQTLVNKYRCCASAVPFVDTASTATFKPSKPTLFDIPVSNNGARVRFVIYKKGLNVDIRPPTDVGGLNSHEYLALNPQGKMPLLVLPTGMAIPESEVIAQYLVAKCKDVGPSLLAPTPEQQAIANLATRIMDTYINAIQWCLYKEMNIELRAQQIAQLKTQLDILEGVVEGPYVVGDDVTTADGCLLATIAWLDYILPAKFGWSSVFQGRPKMAQWWAAMLEDPAGRRVIDELQDGLKKWDEGGRWEKLGISDQVNNKSYVWAP